MIVSNEQCFWRSKSAFALKCYYHKSRHVVFGKTMYVQALAFGVLHLSATTSKPNVLAVDIMMKTYL